MCLFVFFKIFFIKDYFLNFISCLDKIFKNEMKNIYFLLF